MSDDAATKPKFGSPREEDLHWRETTRQMYHDRLKADGRMANKRAALAAAAEASVKGAPAAAIVKLADEFEAWLRKPSKKDGSPVARKPAG